jgi:hypothetical protein
MLKLISCLFIFTVQSGCMFTFKKEVALKSVMLSFTYPRYDGISKVVHRIDTVWFNRIGNTNIFIMPGLREVINEDFLNPVILNYKYFIYNDFDNEGYLYDSINAPNPKQKIIDSFFVRRAYGKVPPLNKYNVKINSFADEYNNIVDVYVLKVKPDRTYADTALLYYNSKYNHLFYSFSKELDSIKGMKLFKFRYIYNADDPKKFADPWPGKEFFWEIQEDTLLKRNEILDFIEKHKSKTGS